MKSSKLVNTAIQEFDGIANMGTGIAVAAVPSMLQAYRSSVLPPSSRSQDSLFKVP
ncbi:MAG: hypothetical protein AAF961_01385 [Planctomycetota bacterium]